MFPSEGDTESPEGLILKAHGDRIDSSYRSGYNTIRITVRRSYLNSLAFCILAALLAVAAYVPVHFMLDAPAQKALVENYVFPLECLFANVVLMVGTPMTFFSLMKNLTDTYIVAERDSTVRRLQLKTLYTSIVAICLALLLGLLTQPLYAGSAGLIFLQGIKGIEATFASVVSSLMPSSVFEIFNSLAPMPLTILALLATYALCTTGKHFDTLKNAADACYSLFSRMLHAVMVVLPISC